MDSRALVKEGDFVMWDDRTLSAAMTVGTGRAAATNAASTGNRSKRGRGAGTHTGQGRDKPL